MAPLPPVFIVNDDFVPPRFRNTNAIIQMHSIPRVTTQKEVTVLVTGTTQDQMDYLMGVYVYAICTFSVFAIWAILIFVFKCCGTKRVGFLAGRAVKLSDPSSDYECEAVRVFEEELQLEEEISPAHRIIDMPCVYDTPTDADISAQQQPPLMQNPDVNASRETAIVDVAVNGGMMPIESPLNADEMQENSNRQMRRTDQTLFWTRIVAIASGIVVILSTSVFINEGVVKLGATLDTGIVGMEHVKGIVQGGIEIIHTFQEKRFSVSDALEDLNVTIVNVSWCPSRREDLNESCSSILSRNGTTQDAINRTDCEILGVPLQDALTTLLVFFRIISGAFSAMDVLLSDLNRIVDLIDLIIPKARSFYWAFYLSATFAVMVDIIILVLLFGVYLAWRKRYNKPFSCARSYFVIPLFVCCVFLMWLFAILFCFTAILTADFCHDGPDARLVYTLNAFRHRFSQHTFELFMHYLTGCPSPGFSILEPQTTAAIVEGVTLVHNLVFDLSQLDPSNFLDICGVSIAPLALLMTSVHTEMHVVADSLSEVQQLFLCSNIFPVLEIIMYDAVCYLGVSSFRNIFVVLLVTMGFCLLFITVRVAWQEDVEFLDAERHKNTCPSCLAYSRSRARVEAVSVSEDCALDNEDYEGEVNTEGLAITHH